MLPLSTKIAFLLFALVTGSFGAWSFYRLYRRIRRGRPDPEPRFDHLPERLGQALLTTLTQSRTFRKRPTVGLFHSFIFYGFAFYGLVNLVDAIDGFYPLDLRPTNAAAATYLFLADLFSFLVLVGVIALVIRRFFLPSRRDFRFNPRTLLHPSIHHHRITRDSLIVSAFILFHVGSRAIGSAAKLSLNGPDPLQPFATLLSHAIPIAQAQAFRIFGYWGALGSVLAFLAYFPYTKHIHIFMAPAKYAVARRPSSGVIPPLNLDLNPESTESIGANHLEDLSWPRILDAYACIQCNRCQDVCPASATGKSLSPAALEINKRMELNQLASGIGLSPFETGSPSPHPLLQFALSPEAAWACTTCGACMQVCPVQDEQMLDILDIRRHQVMIEGEFPTQLQSAFRGMERAQNPWGINRAKRLDWAEGLDIEIKTTDENPTPDVLYWVGCAASYDPSAQKTARAFVQLLDHAKVDFAVLGKKECCTGDSARRAGNELVYRQLADENVSTLNTLNPKLIVASCPHCLNSIGKEYAQIGGNYKVLHHTEYLETLVAAKKLPSTPSEAAVTYHDPCYLGRHNGVYEAPRNLLNILSNSVVEMPRSREGSFCCGAGGAQFWKEEEAGDERISDNRFREVAHTLSTSAPSEKVLAVGCPFCKSMLSSTPLQGEPASEPILIKDVAELLLEGVLRAKGVFPSSDVSIQKAISPIPESVAVAPAEPSACAVSAITPPAPFEVSPAPPPHAPEAAAVPSSARKKWAPKSAETPKPSADTEPAVQSALVSAAAAPTPPAATLPERKKWQPKTSHPTTETSEPTDVAPPAEAAEVPSSGPAPSVDNIDPVTPETPRKKWKPKPSNEA
jgi:Fe-S oxidoreductase